MSKRKEWTLTVEGMTCDHCARTIDEAVGRLPGIVESSTTYEQGETRVVAENGVDAPALARATQDKGYKVVSHTVRSLGAAGAQRGDGETDLLVIGAGSAGFAAAIRASETGASVASLFHPYLTYGEALKLACQTFEKDVSKLSCCAA